MATQGLAARRSAVFLMDRVIEDGRLLAELLPKAVEKLAPDDRARAQRLAVSCLRVTEKCDRLLGPHLSKRPPVHIMNVLRLAVFEICSEGAAPHGVVNAAVEIARLDPTTKTMAGLVNAVLRKISDTGPAAWQKLPTQKMPKWLRKVLIDDYGKKVVEALEVAHAAGAPLDLTLKPGGTAPAGAAKLPGGSVRLNDAGQVTNIEGYASGDWWVQDWSATVPARVLNAKAGEKVLDLCAAPGGKTMQIAATGANVTAVDISKGRMVRVSENLARVGLSAEIVVEDALSYEGGPFDAILLDAPCSATGTIRRHPDLPHAKDGTDFPGLFELQEHLIDRAWSLLRPGGRLVYCTCSLLIDEGEEQVRDALKRHPDMIVDRNALTVDGVDRAWIGAEGLRLRPDFFPDLGGMDGFFVAMFRKRA